MNNFDERVFIKKLNRDSRIALITYKEMVELHLG